MKTKLILNSIHSISVIGFSCFMACLLFSACETNFVTKHAVVDASQTYQVIDGFGVNFNPDQWKHGGQKQAMDLLTDNMGCTLYRFDCFGRANWLNPNRQEANGKWPANYLDSVYRSADWQNAWQAFRYLNSKTIDPYFNVSGIVPPQWNHQGTLDLENFDAYAEMIATMVDWARNVEKLKFSILAPFNETDLGGRCEGPSIPPQNRAAALSAIIKKLDEHHLSDLKLIVFCDAGISNDKIEPVLADTGYKQRIYAFSGHTYGNGDEGDGGWYYAPSPVGEVKSHLLTSAYNKTHIWLNEFGDLDQTNEIDFEFAWRSTRRLFLALRDGANSGQFWDALDNYHKHDSTWSTYGLLKTDTLSWTYKPKTRFFALKQLYKFVKPGFVRIAINAPKNNKYDVYEMWHNELKNIKCLAFISPDGKDFTITGSNLIESDVAFNVQLSNIPGAEGKKCYTYVTTRQQNCELISETTVKNMALETRFPEKCIFTITTIKDSQ